MNDDILNYIYEKNLEKERIYQENKKNADQSSKKCFQLTNKEKIRFDKYIK